MAPDELQTKHEDGTLTISLADLKAARVAQMRATVQAELQHLMLQAQAHRQKILSAKTEYKKKFYKKKLKNISEQAVQMLVTLQRLGPPSESSPTGEEEPAATQAEVIITNADTNNTNTELSQPST